MKKRDVQEFAFNLEDNIFELHRQLESRSYWHGKYSSFFVNDPKRRHIHKATVRDRVLHHAIVRVINPIFEKSFIFDSYSCRVNKGTHRAVERFNKLAWRLSRNNTRTVYVLKCDIKKFFENINHGILIGILTKKIKDIGALSLIREIIGSFHTKEKIGLPLGNVTSQLFANIYLNELDNFIKRKLKIPNYLRYCDDFLILDTDRDKLYNLISIVRGFLAEKLGLELHKDKIIIGRYHKGIDFLGFMNFPHFRILRTKTKKRILTGARSGDKESLISYFGLLKYCQSFGVVSQLLRNYLYG